MVWLTTSMSGFQDLDGPSRYSPFAVFRSVLPPRKNERSLHRSPATSTSGFRCSVHLVHSNRKCRAVSLLGPHSQSVDSTAFVLARSLLRRLCFVRSWQSTFASLYVQLRLPLSVSHRIAP